MKHIIIRQIKNLPYQVVSKFKNLPPESAISLFCDPRGGSTWLAETLNSLPKSIIIDEPLHLNSTKKLQTLGFSWRQHIPAEAEWKEARNLFSSFLKGKTLNKSICCRNTFSEVLASRQLILKIIRGKALLPWFVAQFDFKYRPLMIVRHPFAIASSMLIHQSWNYKFRQFKIPQGPFNEFYTRHKTFLQSLESNEEQLTALWCMSNNTVLKHPQNNQGWITLNYESLILYPEICFNNIFQSWNMKMPETLLNNILNPSSTTVGKVNIDPEQLISDWQTKLNESQIMRLQKVLDYFEVDYYGKDEVLPLLAASDIHLKSAKK